MVPPLPKEASVIRHTSVRGLKRQSDERKRDRESGQYVVNGDCKVCCHSVPKKIHLPTIVYIEMKPWEFLVILIFNFKLRHYVLQIVV